MDERKKQLTFADKTNRLTPTENLLSAQKITSNKVRAGGQKLNLMCTHWSLGCLESPLQLAHMFPEVSVFFSPVFLILGVYTARKKSNRKKKRYTPYGG